MKHLSTETVAGDAKTCDRPGAPFLYGATSLYDNFELFDDSTGGALTGKLAQFHLPGQRHRLWAETDALIARLVIQHALERQRGHILECGLSLWRRIDHHVLDNAKWLQIHRNVLVE